MGKGKGHKSIPLSRKVTEYPKNKLANLVVDPLPDRRPRLNPVPARKKK